IFRSRTFTYAFHRTWACVDHCSACQPDFLESKRCRLVALEDIDGNREWRI
ncbi:MAG: hypothetical protein Q9198_006995, partial [Flavoplaca austrocitrina]